MQFNVVGNCIHCTYNRNRICHIVWFSIWIEYSEWGRVLNEDAYGAVWLQTHVFTLSSVLSMQQTTQWGHNMQKSRRLLALLLLSAVLSSRGMRCIAGDFCSWKGRYVQCNTYKCFTFYYTVNCTCEVREDILYK